MTRISRRRFLSSTAALAATLAHRRAQAEAPPADTPYLLHFNQPAARWPDALPVGNGRLGAMVFGNPALERIQLNEESIWDGQPGLDRNNPKAGQAVPRIRDLLFAGQISDAEALATSDMLSIPRRMPCYQTLGDLHLDFSPMGLAPETKVEAYRLELNLDTAIVTTTFTYQETRYTREVFCSAPDQIVVIRLLAEGPGKLQFRAHLDRPGPVPPELNYTADSLTLDGQALPVHDNPGLAAKEPVTGVRFHSRMLVLARPNEIERPAHGCGAPKDGCAGSTDPNPVYLNIGPTQAVTLLIDCATSYRYPRAAKSPLRLVEGDAPAMRSAVTQHLNAAAKHTYADLRARHVADHRRYFRRAQISFGPDANAAIPTDQRVRAIKHGGEDLTLLPLYLQFGRYMLISSARPGTLAANLQGIWNESVDPPWGSKYTININAQMNYWLANRANLADLHPTLFDLLDHTVPSGRVTAKAYYKARGTVAHHNTDLWGDTGPIDGLGGGIWAMGSAWLSLHLWDQYRFTGDPAFLRARAYPTLRENALFLLDYLVTAPPNTPYAGLLVSGPSCSPENSYKYKDGKHYNLCMSPTMDIAITRAVLTRFIEASTLVHTPDAALTARAQQALTQLPPFKITHDGRLQEWPEDYADYEPGHRHISHLFGLFPGDEITPTRTPALARACRATLDARLAAGGGSTGWSRSWIISCMARLHDGDAAYANLLELFRQSTRPNLFDVCGLKENSPFQIDGNLGGPSGLLEMLLQSHDGVVRLLPALPKAWPAGSFRGLPARTGLELDLTWNSHQATTATLRTTMAGTHTFVPPRGQTIASIRQVAMRRPVSLASAAEGVTVTLQAHTRYLITFS